MANTSFDADMQAYAAACRPTPTLGIVRPIRIRSEVEESRLAFRISLALAVASMGNAYYEWVEPSHPPFKGRLSWVWEIAFTLAGEVGIVLIWLGLGFSFVLMARFVWRRRPRIPSDPWWRGL